jgi:SpoVK/Ycf46/Vps4 family AAA+-type ATPase
MLDLLCHASLLRAMVCIEDAEQCLVSGANTTSALLRALDRYGEMVLFTTTRTEQLPEQVALRCLVHTRLARPDQDARQQIWEVHLPSEVDIHAEVDLRELASLFEFSGAEIRRAAQMAMELARQRQPSAPEVTASDLVAACRLQLEPPGEGLLERTPCTMRLQHIVLAPELRATAELIIAACENQARVLQQWGFGERISTGKGITVLLDGPPGTGKTLLAEIIANETGRPLTRVSLPDLMSKWMGETEKHIREVFRQARASHSVLLFDEADSLFSSRLAETRSANDRSANIEVNLLLQEIERYSGVCVLTTNHAAALDSALTRRIQFRMHFELPGERERAEIWATLAPSGAPFGADVDFCELGRAYELSGGHIKNALLRAAYEAARTSAEISQDLLRAACREECRSMGKVVFDSLPTVSRIAA